MKKLLLALLLNSVFATGIFSQNLVSSIKVGSTGADYARHVVSDAQNNLYVLMYYAGTLALDSAGTPKNVPSFGNVDLAVIKYDCSKVFQWVIRIGGPFADGGIYNFGGLNVDTFGNIFVSCAINGSVNFVSSNGATSTRSTYGQTDGFLLKANNSGIIQWVNLVGSNGGNEECGNVTIDRNQNIYVTGVLFGNTTFQSIGSPNGNRVSLGGGDLFVAKYSQTGSLQYVTSTGSSLLDLGHGIAVDSSGAVYLVGNFGCCANSFANFGGNNLNNSGNWGAYITKIDPNGNFLWANGMGAAGAEGMSAVVVDDINDMVYVGGLFAGNTTFSTQPGGTAQNLSSAGGYDGVLVGMSLNGQVRWSRTFGGTGNEVIYSIGLDPMRNIVVTGDFASATNFGGTTLTPSGSSNAFYAKYRPGVSTSTLLTAFKMGSGYLSNGWNIHVSPTGITYVCGYFQTQLILGTETLNTNGGDDGFVAIISDADSVMIGANKYNLACLYDTAVLYLPNKRIGNFVWYLNDVPYAFTNGSYLKTIVPGNYKAVTVNYCAVLDTSVTITLTKSPYYAAPQISDISICSGDTGRFNASGATTYRWRPATGLSDTTVANPFVKPSSNTTYYLTMTESGCTAFDTATVSIQTNCCLTCASPFQINDGIIACYTFTGNARDESGHGNHATVINAVPALDRFGVANRAYQFNGINAYLEVPTSPSLESPTSKISFSFWANFTNWNFSMGVQWNPVVSKSSSAGSAQYRGMVRSNGAIAMANGRAIDAAIGGTTNTNTWYYFTIAVSNDTLYYYRNGVLLGSATGPTTYTINNTTPLRIGRNDVNSTSYFNGRLDELRIYNRTLTAAEVSALYLLTSLNGKPTVSASTDKNICKDDSVQLVTTGTSTNVTWLWNPSVNLSNDTARSPWSKSDSTRDYIVRVDYAGCRNYDTVRVNVTDFVPSAGTDQTLCYGDSAQIIVSGGGNTFAWTPNYRITPTNNDTVKVFPLVDTNYVLVANNGMCSRSDTIRVFVNQPLLDAGPDKNICQNDTARFTITTNGTVRWSPFKWLSDSVGTAVYSVPDSTISYYLSANYLGCIALDTVLVSVANLPIDAGTNKLICMGDSVQLQATGGANYIWLPSYRISDTSIANPWVKPLMPTYYYAVAYNSLCARYDSVFVDVKQAQANAGSDKTICDGDSVRLTATALGLHTWNPTTGLGDTGLIPYAKPLATTDYILQVNNFGCLAFDTVRVSVMNFAISAGNDELICRGDSVQLNATGSVKYNWLPVYNISDTGVANPWVSPLGPTNYFVISTNGYCWRVDTVFVDVKSVSGTAGVDTSMCEGYSVDLNASGGTAYEWMTKYNLSDYYIPNPVATPAVDYNYVVKISDALSGCAVYDTVFVKVNKMPKVNAGMDKIHCPGEFVTLDGTASDYATLIWSPGTGLNDRLLVQPIASVTTKTKYALFAANGNCFDYDSVEVDVMPTITANFDANPSTGLAPLPVLFQNLSINGNKYTWDFGDGMGGSTDKDPDYIYLEEGTYLVRLLVEDDLGCFDTTSAVIYVFVKETIFIPSAFTPNNDGLNDYFGVIYSPSRFEYVEMSVFNRWGVEIFNTRMPGGIWWDGKINGVAEPSGIFTYYVVARDKKGKSYEFNGTVSIVR